MINLINLNELFNLNKMYLAVERDTAIVLDTWRWLLHAQEIIVKLDT